MFACHYKVLNRQLWHVEQVFKFGVYCLLGGEVTRLGVKGVGFRKYPGLISAIMSAFWQSQPPRSHPRTIICEVLTWGLLSLNQVTKP